MKYVRVLSADEIRRIKVFGEKHPEFLEELYETVFVAWVELVGKEQTRREITRMDSFVFALSGLDGQLVNRVEVAIEDTVGMVKAFREREIIIVKKGETD